MCLYIILSWMLCWQTLNHMLWVFWTWQCWGSTTYSCTDKKHHCCIFLPTWYSLQQLCYTTNIWQGGWCTSEWKQISFVTRGSNGVQLTRKVSQYHAVFAITPSTPQDVKCSQQPDLFSATACNPQRLSISHSQYVKSIQTKTVCITASDLNNLLPVFQQASLFRSDNIHGFQFIILNFTDYSWCPVSYYASKRYGNWHCGYVDQTQ